MLTYIHLKFIEEIQILHNLLQIRKIFTHNIVSGIVVTMRFLSKSV